MPLSKYTEKPGGAKDVNSWHCNVIQDFHPMWYLGGTKPGFFAGEAATVQISVSFWNRDSALEFQRKVIDLLPEVGWGDAT